jgi:AraC-like DNA-binding protein
VHLQLNWINLIILFGGLQGLAFSIVLLFNKKHPGAKFLSALIFVLAYNSFETFNWSSGLNLNFFGLFPYVFIFGIGPSLFLYIQSVLYPEKHVKKINVLIHYIAVIIQFLFRAGLVVYETAAKKFLLTPIVPLGNVEYWHSFISEPLSVVFFLFYLFLSIRLYRKFIDAGEFRHTEYNEQARAWSKALLIVMTCLGVMWPMTVIIPYFIEIPFNAHYYPIEIILVFVIYWIAMRGYHKAQVIYRKQNSTHIPDEKAKEVMLRLIQAMERDGMYLDPDLTLARISTHIEVPAKTISAVINQTTGKSVNDFVNRYRVEKVKEKLAASGSDHLTLTGIALGCGFNSQATFQRAFKQHTGMSPTEFLNSQTM